MCLHSHTYVPSHIIKIEYEQREEVKPLELDEVRALVRNSYGIDIDDIEKIKNVYKIQGSRGVLCLKVIKYELPHFLFILGAILHLQKNNFVKIPEIIPTVDGREYLQCNNGYGYLTEWISARQCNYDNPLDVKVAAKKLAELHNKSEGFELKPYMRPRIGWLKWPKIFSTRKDEILDFQRRIQEKEEKSEFDELYLSMMEEELLRADKALRDLIGSDYFEYMEVEMKKKGFCHHDFAHHNILLSDSGEISVIDFDYCILDSHLHDLSSLLIRIMKNGKWSEEYSMNTISDYCSVKELNKTSIPIMAAFMEFPQEYWQVGIQYYWEKQPWGEDFFLKKLMRIDEDREERQDFIEEFSTMKL